MHELIIETILMEGTPNGVRKLKCGSKSIEVYEIPRNGKGLEYVYQHEEFDRNCLYILLGNEKTEKPQAYIGKTTQGFAKRVKDHDFRKDFWKKAIVFMSNKKDDFSSDDVTYFEYEAIRLAKEVKAYNLSENKQSPKMPSMKETVRISATQLFVDIKFWLTFMGYSILEKDSSVESFVSEVVRSGVNHNLPVFYCFSEKKFVDSMALFDKSNHSMVVLKDSVISKDVTNSYDGRSKREKLIAENCVEVENGYVLKNDLTFSSPSAASDFCLGRSSNGTTVWKSHRSVKDLKDDEKIQTIKEIYGL